MKNSLITLLFLSTLATIGCVRSLNPLVTYPNMITDDGIIGTWEITDPRDEVYYPRITIGRAVKPIYQKYVFTSNQKGNIDTTHTIRSYDLQASYENNPPMRDDMKFTRVDSLPYYIANADKELNDPTGINFKIVLTEINNQLYFDLTYRETAKEGLSRDFNILAHHIGKANVTKDKLEFKLLDYEKFETLLKNKSVRLQHKFVDDGEIIYEENAFAEQSIILTASTDELRSFFNKYGDRDDLFNEWAVYTRK